MAGLTDCRAMPVPLSRWAEARSNIHIDDDMIDKSGQGTFYIVVSIVFEFTWSQADKEGVEKQDVRTVLLTLPRGLLRGDEPLGRSMLTEVLSASKVPARDLQLVAETVVSCARSMARDSHVGVLPMLVCITCRLGDVREPNPSLMLGPHWKRYSVKGLRKVEIEGEAGTCSMCREDIPPGSVAASLPCSHVCHDHCVFTRILQSGTCPICQSTFGKYKIFNILGARE